MWAIKCPLRSIDESKLISSQPTGSCTAVKKAGGARKNNFHSSRLGFAGLKLLPAFALTPAVGKYKFFQNGA
jgi:hypothetical protein